ncbi:cytochrome P450 [Hysterangium stoloniferum]|nr:cytochrome P450 [Hysterangium stoloniferum]
MAELLLDQRGAIYSDRPFPMMSGLLMNRHKSMFYMSYTERLKTYRKLMQHDFNTRAAQKYWSLQEHEAHVFLQGLLQTPENVFGHIRRFSGAVIMKIGYGYEVKSENDYYLGLAQESMRVASLAAAPGRWLVDSLPILRYVPSWFPGAGFKRKAAEWGQTLYAQSLEPHEYVKSEIAAGMAVPSFTSKYLAPDDGPPADQEQEDLVLWTAGALYSAGSDTTASVVTTFFFAMTLHPEIQRRAQTEIDTVIGQHRLPGISDRGSLPYVEAVIKEVIRWGTVSPMALPHTTAADDEVLGYKIPKGCVVIPNLWAMLHDESVYPDPLAFDPTRFIGEKQQPDPKELVFGRGRRVCPGQHIAEASVFIQVASVLAGFDILRALDDAGREIIPEVGFTTAIVSYVQPFKCRVVPRREEIRSLIEQAVA